MLFFYQHKAQTLKKYGDVILPSPIRDSILKFLLARAKAFSLIYFLASLIQVIRNDIVISLTLYAFKNGYLFSLVYDARNYIYYTTI